METRYIAEIIRESVSAIDAAEAMGMRMDMHHRCPCPFHGGEHNNLKLYPEARGFYCFVCHEHGSVIDLVMKVQECGFMDAVRWLNETFRLGIDTNERSIRNRERRALRSGGQYVENRRAARQSHREQRQRQGQAGA